MSISDVDATAIECPTCGAWIGWACKGKNYGYHAAGYHPSREHAAASKQIDPSITQGKETR